MPDSAVANTITFGPGAAFACAIASRKLPAPLSLRFVTVKANGAPLVVTAV